MSPVKGEILLKVDPENELRFRGPFKEPVCIKLKLSNCTSRKVCFKVKTTAPKRYCVKPTTGVLEGKAEVEVLVSLQPFDPKDPSEKGKHKFQVLSTYAPDGEFSVDTVWKDATPDQIQDCKLKCVLEVPDEETSAGLVSTTPEVNNGLSSKDGISGDASREKVLKLETELQKASDEITKLREELSATTRENIQLKEEGIRLRRTAAASSATGSPLAQSAHSARQPAPIVTEQGVQNSQLVLILAALFLGIILAQVIF